MKILVVTLTRDFDARKKGRWHRLPGIFRDLGHKVCYLGYRNWPGFYFYYLALRPDVVIVTSISGFLPVLLKKLGLMRRPVILDWVDDYTKTMGRKWGAALIAFLEYFTLQNADYITTPSRYLLGRAAALGRKAVLLEHGIDEAFTRNAAPKKLAGAFKIIYAGDLEVKQIECLINAVSGTKHTLYLIGETKMREAPENTRLLGFVPNDELYSYLLGADVLAITADQASSLKMYEYMSAGKPIIARKGEAGYFFDHGETALLVDDFRKGIDLLYRNKRLREKLASSVRKMKIRSWREAGKEYIKLLEQIKADHNENRDTGL